MDSPSTTKTPINIWAIGFIILLVVLVVIVGYITIPLLTSGSKLTEKVQSPNIIANETDVRGGSTAPINKTEPLFDGRNKVPDTIPTKVLNSVTEEKTGVVYEDKAKNHIYIFVHRDYLQEVRRNVENGTGVTEPNAPPQVKGGFIEGEDFTTMDSAVVNGIPIWRSRTIKASETDQDVAYYKMDYCIFIGYANKGNWDKYLHDEVYRQSGKKYRIPGSFTNNAHGMNCWVYTRQ